MILKPRLLSLMLRLRHSNRTCRFSPKSTVFYWLFGLIFSISTIAICIYKINGTIPEVDIPHYDHPSGKLMMTLPTVNNNGIKRGNEFAYFNSRSNQRPFKETMDITTDTAPTSTITNVNAIWTRISDSVHTYSAHLDPRIKKDNLTLIRILGIKRVPPVKEVIKINPLGWLRIKDETYFGHEYFCRVFFVQDIRSKLVSLKGQTLTYHIIEEGIKKFASCYFNCYVDLRSLLDNITLTKKSKLFVALYPKDVDNYPTKLIPVTIPAALYFKWNSESSLNENISKPSPLSLGLCVRPLFGPMDDLLKLVQFISYYHSMGVGFMTFYDLSISPRVRNFLTKLSHFGIQFDVQLMNWNLPTGNTSELWDYGSLAALNDCLLRNIDREFLVFVDIDEFIVPQKPEHKNLMDLISFIAKENPHFSQLLVRNTFFCQEFCPQNTSSIDDRSPFLVGEAAEFPIKKCLMRTKRIWNVKLRTKFIINPRKVIAVGHHLVNSVLGQKDHRFSKEGDTIHIPKEVALLNHYRECGSLSTTKSPILNRLTVKDEGILRFTEDMKPFLLPIDKESQ